MINIKKLLLIFLLILITSCSNDVKIEKEVYNQFLKEITNATEDKFNKTLPFDIDVSFDALKEIEIAYQVTIDNPRENIRNIKVIAVHDQETKDLFPTSGIFEEPLNLIPNVVNLDSNYVKGIILVGYIPYTGYIENFTGEIKVLIEYEDDLSNLHQVFYRFEI
ncbi:MAG: hypothetical protein ACOXZR_02635 [Bacilli bacterium]|jgi:hypothetical protein